MPRHRRRRPPIPVTPILPAEPPTQAETCPERSRRIDAILMAPDSIIGQETVDELSVIGPHGSSYAVRPKKPQPRSNKQ